MKDSTLCLFSKLLPLPRWRYSCIVLPFTENLPQLLPSLFHLAIILGLLLLLSQGIAGKRIDEQGKKQV